MKLTVEGHVSVLASRKVLLAVANDGGGMGKSWYKASENCPGLLYIWQITATRLGVAHMTHQIIHTEDI